MIELRKFVWQLESVAFLWKHEFLSGGGKFSGLPKIFQQALDLFRERLVNAQGRGIPKELRATKHPSYYQSRRRA